MMRALVDANSSVRKLLEAREAYAALRTGAANALGKLIGEYVVVTGTPSTLQFKTAFMWRDTSTYAAVEAARVVYGPGGDLSQFSVKGKLLGVDAYKLEVTADALGEGCAFIPVTGHGRWPDTVRFPLEALAPEVPLQIAEAVRHNV